MKLSKTLQMLATCVAGLTLCSTICLAGPPGGPGGPGGPGRGGPGGPGGHPHAGDIVGGAIALGLGVGLANAIIDSTVRPAPPPPAVTYAVPPGYVAPSTVIVTPPPAVAVPAAPSGTQQFWCEASKNYYPYVTECPSGWKVYVTP